MRILFVADGRSPIALNWIRYFAERGDEVYLATTFACQPELSLHEIEFTPVAYSGARARGSRSHAGTGLGLRWRTVLRQILGPLTLRRSAQSLQRFIDHVHPDVVHAMRIPFEGMLAANARSAAPLVVSVWGNDFTLHAPSTPLMRHHTEWTMTVADGLHADCHRDVRLARQWGLSPTRPTLVIPGSGGIRTEVFYAPREIQAEPVVINPRGARAYVRTDVFLHAIPEVLRRLPGARFLCPGLVGDRGAERTIRSLGIQRAVQLLPHLPQAELAGLFRGSQVLISPSTHDGTPNTLLEGMACGCLPVAGNLESIREWIRDGENGVLVDASDAGQVAQGILRGLENENLRRQAAGLNRELVRQRAEYGPCMQRAAEFYVKVIADSAAASTP
jgi:hypothetical protein